MRPRKKTPWIVLFLLALLPAALAGCVDADTSGAETDGTGPGDGNAVDPASQEATLEERTPERRELASGTFAFTSPEVANLDVTVPPNTTRVRIVIDYEMTHYVGLYLEGVPGCEVSQPDAVRSAVASGSEFGCDHVPPGTYTLTLRYDAGMGKGSMKLSGRVPATE